MAIGVAICAAAVIVPILAARLHPLAGLVTAPLAAVGIVKLGFGVGPGHNLYAETLGMGALAANCCTFLVCIGSLLVMGWHALQSKP